MGVPRFCVVFCFGFLEVYGDEEPGRVRLIAEVTKGQLKKHHAIILKLKDLFVSSDSVNRVDILKVKTKLLTTIK